MWLVTQSDGSCCHWALGPEEGDAGEWPVSRTVAPGRGLISPAVYLFSFILLIPIPVKRPSYSHFTSFSIQDHSLLKFSSVTHSVNFSNEYVKWRLHMGLVPLVALFPEALHPGAGGWWALIQTSVKCVGFSTVLGHSTVSDPKRTNSLTF